MASDEPSPATKKISFAELDLEVTVGSGETRTVYMYHALVMAIWSNYIDRMLSSTMKEGQTKKITFPEIEPHEWEAMMMYLESGKRETPHVDEAKRLAKWYDKYEFQNGLAMCDGVIHDFITSEGDGNLDAKSDAYSLACNHNLVRSQQGGTTFFAEVLRDPLRRSRLTLADISTLAPPIGQMDELWAAVERILPTIEGQVNREVLVQETCFPMLLHQVIQKEDRVSVKGAGVSAVNGIYVREEGTRYGVPMFAKKGIWNGNEETFSLFRNTTGTHWWISILAPVGVPRSVDFYCAPSAANYPPGQRWVAHSNGVAPAPTVECQLTWQV